MTQDITRTCSAFSGSRRIASGALHEVALKAKEVMDRDKWAQVLIFDDATSELVEVDLRGIPKAHLEPEQAARRPAGRPKLGVVAREVTLLPRHWDWLANQPGGASVALRKLVDQARSANRDSDARRRAQEAAYRFLSAMGGNEPGFEEAARALFAGNQKTFEQILEAWPPDVRDHAKRLAALAFEWVP
jgi:hypothetical protein